MAISPEREAIFETWWDLFHCLPPERANSEKRLNLLVDQIVAKGNGALTRDQVLNFLWSDFCDYRRERRQRERISVARSVMPNQ